MTAGLRERKKARTRREIASAALGLATERGLEAVTVDDIAERAGVSPRTVFNYFATKDDAILGIDPDAPSELRDAVIARPVKERPLDAIHHALVELIDDSHEVIRRWRQRVQLLHRYPQLLPAHLAGRAAYETALASAVAERTGLDVDRDAYPRLVAGVALKVMWTTIDRHRDGADHDVVSELDLAFALLARGLRP